MNKTVSVIIPVYKCEDYVGRCIESVLAQTYRELDIILVDDGTPDNSGIICDEYAQKDNRIRVFHKENGGVATARNLALDNINGEYVVFIDSDDYVDDKYIETLCANMTDDVDMVVSKPRAVNPDGTDYKYWRFSTTESVTLEPEDKKNMFWQYRHFWVHSVLFRSSVIGETKFNPRYLVSQDTPFYCTVYKKCRKIKYIPEKLYNYVMFEESACHGKFNERKFTEFYAWQEIKELFEGHPLYEEYLSNYEMRCYRLYMLMLDAGMQDDERTQLLVKELRANLKYGIHLNGYKPYQKRDFIVYSTAPKALHKGLRNMQTNYYKTRTNAVKTVKKIIGR